MRYLGLVTLLAVGSPAMAQGLPKEATGIAPKDSTNLGQQNDKSQKKSEDIELKGLNVTARRRTVLKDGLSVVNKDILTSGELLRAACCNLGESFTTNPSVDVSYSDAATGAKQIKLLGLSNTYVQLLSENIPNYRGAAAPYALGYIPGTWMQSIAISTGASSVKNGYEGITGQIDVEYKKPQLPQSLTFNAYANTKQRYEANFDGNIHLNNKVSTALFAHYENTAHMNDKNGDNFMDMPKMHQYNLMNRWTWMSNHHIFQAGIKALKEERTSGQIHATTEDGNNGIYRIGINTERYEGFLKNAIILNQEKNTNIAVILNGTLHKQDADYGLKLYDVNQKNGYASLLFETNFDKHNSLSTGISLNYDYYRQDFRLTNDRSLQPEHNKETETVPGAYAQYTYNLNDKLTLMGGIRIDHSDIYGTFATPRFHVKWSPNSIFTVRLSAGKGYRTPHVLAENNFLLASSRKVEIDKNLDQEEAWNYGISTIFNIPVANKMLNINAQYYYTDFQKQTVIDMDSDPHAVRFTNLNGKSYSHTFQIDATYPFFSGFSLTAAYRYMDVKTTYGGQLLEKPLLSKYKGLLTASYKTPFGEWQFDATLQLNGGGRMPNAYTTADGTPSWDARFKPYQQLNAQITRFFKHWSVYIGGENITNFKQKTPIIDAANPWGNRFDSTMIWGPVEGAVYYLGFRLTLK